MGTQEKNLAGRVWSKRPQSTKCGTPKSVVLILSLPGFCLPGKSGKSGHTHAQGNAFFNTKRDYDYSFLDLSESSTLSPPIQNTLLICFGTLWCGCHNPSRFCFCLFFLPLGAMMMQSHLALRDGWTSFLVGPSIIRHTIIKKQMRKADMQ